MKNGKTNKMGAISDVDPQDVIDVVRKTIKIFKDLRKKKS